MALFSGVRHCRETWAFAPVLVLVACALGTASCSSSDTTGNPSSYQAAAIEASAGGDQKAAISLAKKEVARFSTPDQCSPANSLNCGTLALAYSSLAEYQILDGDKMAGEASFASAKRALDWTDRGNKASATGMVYRDVSEAFWRVGDRARAIDVFKEGRAAGGDNWLYTSSAARAVEPGRRAPPEAAPRGHDLPSGTGGR
ncbi:MAG TPA: hypothetical protein VEC60_00405 [Reyranella sp.]|nr:hypothetical protein [Reyranella sp.]